MRDSANALPTKLSQNSIVYLGSLAIRQNCHYNIYLTQQIIEREIIRLLDAVRVDESPAIAPSNYRV